MDPLRAAMVLTVLEFEWFARKASPERESTNAVRSGLRSFVAPPAKPGMELVVLFGPSAGLGLRTI